jgi:hypothetical protein
MSGNLTNEKEDEFDPNDFDFDNESDDEWRPEKGMTGPVGKMDEMTGKSNLGFEYVQSLNPDSRKQDVRWIDKTLNAAYPLDVTFSAPTGNSIIEDVAHLKGQYNPSNEELTQKQNMQIINAGLDVLREQNPPKLPVKAPARPLSKVSYMKPPAPPKYKRGGASRKMRKSRKTKKPRRARRVKTQMRRKNSSRKSTRRRTRK